LFFLLFFWNGVLLVQESAPFDFDRLEKEIKQSTYFDSLSVFTKGKIAIAVAKEEKDQSKESLIYQHFGNYNYFSGKLETADAYYDTSIYLAHQAKDSSLALTGKIRKAFILSDKDVFQAEKEFYKLLHVAIKRNDKKNCFEAYNSLGIISEKQQNQSQALAHYLEGLKIAEELNDLYMMGIAYNNIGLLKVRNNQYDEAKIDFQKGLKFADSVNEIRLAFNLHNNLGLLYYSEEDPEAIKHYQLTLEQAEKLGFPYALLIAHLNLSNSHNLNKDYEKAIEHANKAIDIMEKTNTYDNLGLACFVISDSYKSMGKHQMALKYVEKGLNNALKVKNIGQQQQGYLLKSELLELQGNHKNALATFKKYHQLTDSIIQLNNRQMYDELQIAYETEKKEAELLEERTKLDLLKKDNRIKESRFILVIVVSLVLLLLIVLSFYLRNARTKKNQQKKFSQELIKSLDEERSRISRDLHDDIGQSLSAIKSRVNLLKKGHVENVEDLENNLGQVLEPTRRISHQLHPSFLEKIGLIKSFSNLLESVENSTNIITSHELDNSVDDLSLSDQTQLYRILQECISNTLKHASAKSIKVSLLKEGAKTVFIYRDNGVGVQKATSQKSFGIGMMTIKERVHKLSGKLVIGNNKGKGFRLIVIF
jgi:signal transduction histidine kinase